MRDQFRIIVALSILIATAGTAVAATNEAPLAEAGLDQSVERTTTVYLDAGGSRDPDGTITNYSWHVEAPDGTTTTPACADCERTSFVPRQTGQYNVTMTVRDDDGATRSDTMHVLVTKRAPPSVSLDGPDSVTTDSNATFDATATAGNAHLHEMVWRVNGSTVATTSLSGNRSSGSYTVHSGSSGTKEITVTVRDRHGQTATSTTTLDVSDPSFDSTPNVCGYASDYDTFDTTKSCDKIHDGTDKFYGTSGGGQVAVNVNGQSGIQDASEVPSGTKNPTNDNSNHNNQEQSSSDPDSGSTDKSERVTNGDSSQSDSSSTSPSKNKLSNPSQDNSEGKSSQESSSSSGSAGSSSSPVLQNTLNVISSIF